jgi:hypothetical protein
MTDEDLTALNNVLGQSVGTRHRARKPAHATPGSRASVDMSSHDCRHGSESSRFSNAASFGTFRVFLSIIL